MATSPELDAPLIIDSEEGLRQFSADLQNTTRLAIDTESNSLFAYREQVCLIQLSTDDADYLIDPIRISRPDLFGFLGDALADPQIEKVLHAAEYDVRCLRRDFGFTFAGIFDTLIAARLLNWEQVGLGNILENTFGVRVNKRHQRADWGQRPLSPALIHYAQIDTHYLLPLRDILYEQLQEGGFLEEAAELFDEMCHVEWSESEFDPDGYWQIKGARDLSPRETAILHELYIYRENQAIQRDQPVFKILSEQTLIDLAQHAPRSVEQLRAIPAMTEGQIRRYGQGILKSIQHGLQAEPPRPPKRSGHRFDDSVLQRYDALHTWRKERAQQRGMPSEYVLSREALWELAQVAPRTSEQLGDLRSIGPWRCKTYGDEILNLLARLDGSGS